MKEDSLYESESTTNKQFKESSFKKNTMISAMRSMKTFISERDI